MSWLDRNSASRLMKSRRSSLCYEVRGEEIEKPAPLASNLPDPGDDKFLACAKAANVDFIVTGNKRHFPPRACGAIRVVNAAQLLDRITLEL